VGGLDARGSRMVPVVGSCGNEHSGSIKAREVFDYLSDY
jgi:hypothetical protein